MIGWAIWAKNVDRNTKKCKRLPKSSKNQMFIHFWIMFNFWWLAERSKQIMLTEMQKNEKGPISHQKIKCSFLDYIQLLMIGRVIRAKTLTEMQKNKKGPQSHRKIKCLFLDYIQLLMIGWAIWTKNIDQNTKKWKRPPKSSKNKMFIFGLCSTSDDWLSDLSKKCWLKHKKM